MLSKNGLIICISFLSLNAWAINEPIKLSVPDKGIIPIEGGSLQIQIHNTGKITAYNIQANIPEEWSNVVQDSSQCSFVEPGQSCTLSLSSSEPYLAKIVTIAGEYTNEVTISIGFSVHNYLVYNVDKEKHIASVIYSSNAKSAPWIYTFWDSNYLVGALSQTDGHENTKKIYDLYKRDGGWNSARKTDPGAAVNCKKLKADGGDWYLPAVQQMFVQHNWGITNTLQKYNNSDDHTVNRLLQLGLGDLAHSHYWTSTELDTRKWPDFREPTAEGVFLGFLSYKGNRYDHSAHLIPNYRNKKGTSRCVKDISY